MQLNKMVKQIPGPVTMQRGERKDWGEPKCKEFRRGHEMVLQLIDRQDNWLAHRAQLLDQNLIELRRDREVHDGQEATTSLVCRSRLRRPCIMRT